MRVSLQRALLCAATCLVVAPARADLFVLPDFQPASAEAEAETERWLQIVREKGDQGGWLVVRGTRVGDPVVEAVSLGTLTHAVILDKQKEEVIEADSSGVRVAPLRPLLAQAHRLQIVRSPGWTPEAGRAAVARARAHVGRNYDWLGRVAARDDARFYCTELAVEAYGGRQKDWKLGRVIFPADLAGLGALIVDLARKPAPAPAPVANLAASLEARFARRLQEARGVDYAAEVAPGIFRGAQPDAEGVAWLKSMGVKTVINLRHFHGDTERKRVEAAGLRYERIPLESTDAPKAEQLAKFLALVRDPALRPVYVHCLHGVDRTGALMAVFRMEEQGWSNAEAFAEMQHFNAHGALRDLLNFVNRYRARPQAKPSGAVSPAPSSPP